MVTCLHQSPADRAAEVTHPPHRCHAAASSEVLLHPNRNRPSPSSSQAQNLSLSHAAASPSLARHQNLSRAAASFSPAQHLSLSLSPAAARRRCCRGCWERRLYSLASHCHHLWYQRSRAWQPPPAARLSQPPQHLQRLELLYYTANSVQRLAVDDH